MFPYVLNGKHKIDFSFPATIISFGSRDTCVNILQTPTESGYRETLVGNTPPSTNSSRRSATWETISLTPTRVRPNTQNSRRISNRPIRGNNRQNRNILSQMRSRTAHHFRRENHSRRSQVSRRNMEVRSQMENVPIQPTAQQ